MPITTRNNSNTIKPNRCFRDSLRRNFKLKALNEPAASTDKYVLPYHITIDNLLHRSLLSYTPIYDKIYEDMKQRQKSEVKNLQKYYKKNFSEFNPISPRSNVEIKEQKFSVFVWFVTQFRNWRKLTNKWS